MFYLGQTFSHKQELFMIFVWKNSFDAKLPEDANEYKMMGGIFPLC